MGRPAGPQSNTQVDTAPDDTATDRAPGPTDPDIDLHVPHQRHELVRAPWAVLGTIAVGGALGALARYGISTALPHPGPTFPWATFVVNVAGCFLIGVLMVLVTEVWSTHRLVRPFLGVGVLGGFTTFSTSMVDSRQLMVAGAARTALLYLLGTVVAALVAVFLGALSVRVAARPGATR